MIHFGRNVIKIGIRLYFWPLDGGCCCEEFLIWFVTSNSCECWLLWGSTGGGGWHQPTSDRGHSGHLCLEPRMIFFMDGCFLYHSMSVRPNMLHPARYQTHHFCAEYQDKKDQMYRINLDWGGQQRDIWMLQEAERFNSRKNDQMADRHNGW